MRSYRRVLLCHAAALSLGLSGSGALAALGADASSVAADRVALAAQMRSTALVQYDVHQITQGALTINEFVSRQGQVFAVSWQGPVPPDLQQLLGDYFARFHAATLAAAPGAPPMHRQFALIAPDLVIHTSGRLRSFRGVAYLPGLLPAGVSPDQLQ
jgi:Protein of unknown function (DUF2844)